MIADMVKIKTSRKRNNTTNADMCVLSCIIIIGKKRINYDDTACVIRIQYPL